MEQLIVTAVFAICAAACVRILVASYFMAIETRDASNSILIVENYAESYKAAAGDVDEAARIVGAGAIVVNSGIMAYYDDDWNACSEESASYRLHLVDESEFDSAPMLSIARISIEKIDGEVILSIPVASAKMN